MQNGKKPSREQRKLLIENGKDAHDWLYIKMKDNNSVMIFMNKNSNEIIEIKVK